ncbi:MAG: ATP-binding protein [Proteobacteria bacterium]|nr:ATP-binding protein [Pseudomonadota bacterium]
MKPQSGDVRHLAAPALAVSAEHLSVRELTRLRWLAIAAQAITIVAVDAVWGVALPTIPLLVILGSAAVTNVVLSRRAGLASQRLVALTLLVDVALLTGVLALTGGPANPFSVLYLVHVMLAAIVTTSRWTWAVVAMSSAGFGLLFLVSVPLPPELGGHAMDMEHRPYSAHLQGMWLAYTLVAAVIAGFVSRLSTALRQERETRSRASRLLGLATLAAGAAHEIGNPLATIRVAASELKNDLAAAGASHEILDDLNLIDAEVNRAHDVLDRMSVGAGELAGEYPVATDLAQLLTETIRQLGPLGARVDIAEIPAGQTVRWPVQAATQALSQLVRNAVEASPAGTPVQCFARIAAEGVEIEVLDCGNGMTREVLDRIGEPFFTTRPHQGTGLGMFIARSLIEHLGGRIAICSSVGKGTRVSVWLPAGVG